MVLNLYNILLRFLVTLVSHVPLCHVRCRYSLLHIHVLIWRFVDSRQDGDGEVQVAELGARQDLEVVGHRQGRVPGRGRVRAGHAPHPREDRRTRPALRAAPPPGAAFQEELTQIMYWIAIHYTTLNDPGETFSLGHFLVLLSSFFLACTQTRNLSNFDYLLLTNDS